MNRARIVPPAVVAAVYGALALAGLVFAISNDSAGPDIVVLAVFAAISLWAENAHVLLPSAISVSPSLMVVIATIAALDGHGVLTGAALVGAANGLTWELIRRRRVASVVVNASQFLVSSVAAGWAYQQTAAVPAVVRVVLTGLAFAIVNVGLVLPAAVLLYQESASKIWADMRPALPGYLAFGALGALVGELYDTLGPLAIVLLLTPIVIARATFHSFLQLVEAHDATIGVFLRAIHAKDEYTGKHTERVCRYSVYIGEQLGLPHSRLQHLHHAALMHDIGKLAVPKHLLNKPGKLTDDEFKRVQRHAHVCIDILDLVDFLKPMTAAAAGHHARYDGGGYGGTGERPLEAYIVGVADAYDAMTSTRSYRRALPMEVAFDELRSKAGTQFHPDCVEALIAAIVLRGERHGFGHEIDTVAFDVPPPVTGVGSAGLGDRAPGGQEVLPPRTATTDAARQPVVRQA